MTTNQVEGNAVPATGFAKLREWVRNPISLME